eukprot:177299_1
MMFDYNYNNYNSNNAQYKNHNFYPNGNINEMNYFDSNQKVNGYNCDNNFYKSDKQTNNNYHKFDTHSISPNEEDDNSTLVTSTLNEINKSFKINNTKGKKLKKKKYKKKKKKNKNKQLVKRRIKNPDGMDMLRNE